MRRVLAFIKLGNADVTIVSDKVVQPEWVGLTVKLESEQTYSRASLEREAPPVYLGLNPKTRRHGSLVSEL